MRIAGLFGVIALGSACGRMEVEEVKPIGERCSIPLCEDARLEAATYFGLDYIPTNDIRIADDSIFDRHNMPTTVGYYLPRNRTIYLRRSYFDIWRWTGEWKLHLIIVHELGHAVGFEHEDVQEFPLMNEYVVSHDIWEREMGL